MSGPILLALRLGMTLSLYFFIGWAFLFLWQNFKVENALLATRKTPPLTLTFEDIHQNEKTIDFSDPEIMLGRDPHCEVCLENETVSARHARLSYHHGQWWLEDLKSTNGTTLNGGKVETPTIVIDGDEIHCGKAFLMVRLGVGNLSQNTLAI